MTRWAAGFLILAALLSAGLARSPGPLYQDEAADLVNGWCLGHTGRDEHGAALPVSIRSFGDEKAPLLSYLDAVLLRLWPGREAPRLFGRYVAAGLNALAFAMLGGLAAGLAGRGGKWVWAAPLLYLLNPLTFHLSRVGMEIPSLMPLSLAAYLAAVFGRRWGAAGLILGLSQYALHPMKVLAAPLVLLEAGLLSRAGDRRGLARLLGTFVVVSLVFWLQVLSGRGLERARQVGVGGSPVSMAALAVEQYPSHFSPAFLLLEGDQNLRHSPGGAGLIAWGIAALALWGLYRGRKLLHAPHAGEWTLRLAVLLILAPLPSALTREGVPHAARSYMLALVLVFIAALAALDLAHWKGRGRVLAQAGLAAALFLLACQTGLFLRRYFTAYPAESAQAWLAGVQPWLRPGGEGALDHLLAEHGDLVRRVSGETEMLRWECLRLDRCSICP